MKQSANYNNVADTLQRERGNSATKLENSSETAKEKEKEPSPLEILQQKVAEAEQSGQDEEDDDRMLSCRTLNEVLLEAQQLPDPKPLYKNVWFEGELSCLFADSNNGKSVLATQVCEDIARKGEPVLYFDFEMSPKQWQLRYTKEETGRMYKFSDNFSRVELNPEGIVEEKGYEKALMDDMGRVIKDSGCTKVVIDNLTAISSEAQKADVAALLMRYFKHLKTRYGLSMLVISHTPKRNTSLQITRNDLMGSSVIFNLCDSVFAIGRSAKDNDIRYLKQLKARTGEIVYDSENVLLLQMSQQDDGFLGFFEMGTAREAAHLRTLTDEDVEKQALDVMALHKRGLSYQLIADKLLLSKSKVQRIIKKHK